MIRPFVVMSLLLFSSFSLFTFRFPFQVLREARSRGIHVVALGSLIPADIDGVVQRFNQDLLASQSGNNEDAIPVLELKFYHYAGDLQKVKKKKKEEEERKKTNYTFRFLILCFFLGCVEGNGSRTRRSSL
jgi:hypothetical protein